MAKAIVLSKRSCKIVNRALAAMQRMPETFDMRSFISHDGSVEGKEPYCGTVACIAGHIAIAATGRLGDDWYPDMYVSSELPKWLRSSGTSTHAAEIAMKVLRIDNEPGIFMDFNLKTPQDAAKALRAWLKNPS